MSPVSAALLAGLAVAVAGAAPAGVDRLDGRRRVRGRLAGAARPPGPLTSSVGRALADAGVGWPAVVVVRTCLACAAVAVLSGALVGGPLVGATAAAVVVASTLVARGATAGRAARLADRQLPGALDAVARSLRSGASVHAAVADAADAAPPAVAADLHRVAAELASGLSLDDALAGWVGRCPRPPVRLAAAVLTLAAEAGGPGARAVEGVAASVRAEQEVTAEVRALASQAQASAFVIASAPLGFLALAGGIDPGTVGFLVHEPLGRLCLLGGLTLDGLGAWWMHRIASRPR
jgi:tight adherence protein B